MANAKTAVQEEMEKRFTDYMLTAEVVAQYLHGMADALTVVGGELAKDTVRHLRLHAHDLNMGPLRVMHNYEDNRKA